MKKETYVKCMDFIRSTPSGVVIVNNLGKLFTFITAACYLFITAGCIWGRLWQELIIATMPKDHMKYMISNR